MNRSQFLILMAVCLSVRSSHSIPTELIGITRIRWQVTSVQIEVDQSKARPKKKRKVTFRSLIFLYLMCDQFWRNSTCQWGMRSDGWMTCRMWMLKRSLSGLIAAKDFSQVRHSTSIRDYYCCNPVAMGDYFIQSERVVGKYGKQIHKYTPN